MKDIQKYKYRTELHLHTSPASKCSEIPPELAVKQYAEMGYHGIVLTNHFYPDIRFREDKERCIEAYLADYDVAMEAGKEYGINVILGCEMRFTENGNDYLLFGIDKEDFSMIYDGMEMGLAAFSELFRSRGGVIIQAHPMRKGMKEVDPKYLDGIEAFNVNIRHNSKCAACAVYAREHDLIMIAGSDYHHPGEQGHAALRTKNEMKNSYDIAEVLKSRDYLLEIGGCILLP